MKIWINILLVISLVLFLSSCKKKSETEKSEEQTITEDTNNDIEDISANREEISNPSVPSPTNFKNIAEAKGDLDGDEIQELASSDWEESDPEAITKWFNKAVVNKSPDENNGKQLRRIVRLLKKWARSRNSWNMPSGLILSILSEECYVSVLNRDDDSFYKTIKAIKNRLYFNKVVNNPTNGKEITSSDKHKNKVQNLYDKLTEMFDSTKGINLSELETTQDKKKALLR